MKELGRIWNSMSAVERLPFESMAAQDKLRHAGVNIRMTCGTHDGEENNVNRKPCYVLHRSARRRVCPALPRKDSQPTTCSSNW